MVVLAGLGVAAAFAPAWDSYLLRTAAGESQFLTEGNAFSNPGLVIAGNVAVMVALAAVVIVAALWRPVRRGGAAGRSGHPDGGPGYSGPRPGRRRHLTHPVRAHPAQATQLGLTIDPVSRRLFRNYCGFLVALVVSCAWMLFAARGTPIGARLAGRTRRLRLEPGRSGRRTRVPPGAQRTADACRPT